MGLRSPMLLAAPSTSLPSSSFKAEADELSRTSSTVHAYGNVLTRPISAVKTWTALVMVRCCRKAGTDGCTHEDRTLTATASRLRLGTSHADCNHSAEGSSVATQAPMYRGAPNQPSRHSLLSSGRRRTWSAGHGRAISHRSVSRPSARGSAVIVARKTAPPGRPRTREGRVLGGGRPAKS